jgi:PAS domain S-box-containing protein
LDARVTGRSEIELLESLKKVTNVMIESIQSQITRREQAESALKHAYDELENKIHKRTEALRLINEKLSQEVSERKRIEEHLREAELRYQTIADFTFAWEYWETPDGRLIYVSPSAERVSGYTAEHFIQNARFISEIIIPEDRDIWAQHHHDAYSDLHPRDIMFRIRRKDGVIRWIEHICQPVMDKQGKFLGIRASNRDITLRKETEKKLRDALSLLSATIESTADGILVVNTQGKIVIYNNKFLQLWNIPQAVIEQREDDRTLSFVLDQLKNPEEFLQRVKELYDHPDEVSFDVLEFNDGRVFERFSHPQIIGNTIMGRVWSFRDVTKRRQAEKALRESEQLLLQAHKMEAIGRLAAGVAHEINNPLAVINEKAGLMKDFLELSEDFQQHREKFISLIQGIFDSVGRCRTITHRLLGFSRRVDASLETFDLNEVVREVIDFVEKELLYKNVQTKIVFAEDLPHIESDKGQLQQVILNILNNAVDAVEKGGIIEVETRLQDEHTVTISITDNGHGIPESILNHIFEPFFTTKEKDKGTGLGLSISYGIMKKLGGTISVRSKVNEGTTFILEIPRKAQTT